MLQTVISNCSIYSFFVCKTVKAIANRLIETSFLACMHDNIIPLVFMLF